jgi:putative methyltransferase (TIGR04325 family)
MKVIYFFHKIKKFLWRSFVKQEPSPVGIWQGVYDSFEKVPDVQTVFGPQLIDLMSQTTEWILKEIDAGKTPFCGHEALGVLASTLVLKKKEISIVDFGGGLGTGFLQLLCSLPKDTQIRYFIVDEEKMCEKGRSLFRGWNNLAFGSELTEKQINNTDIIYINSVLQYIENYASVLQKLVALGAEFILFDRLAAGNNPYFVSRQLNAPGQALPYMFLNIAEFRSLLSQYGYRVICDQTTSRQYNQDSLPFEYRVERFRTTLFVKSSS